jgi:hypothetical protein
MSGGFLRLFAAPWFLYRFAVHPRWFWTEHFAVEILGFGAGGPRPHETKSRSAMRPPHGPAAAGRRCYRDSRSVATCGDAPRRPCFLAAWIAIACRRAWRQYALHTFCR